MLKEAASYAVGVDTCSMRMDVILVGVPSFQVQTDTCGKSVQKSCLVVGVRHYVLSTAKANL